LVLPLSLAAAANAQFRMAPVTAALLLLAIPVGGGSFNVALYRIADIALGGVLGAAAVLFVLPERRVGRMAAHRAAALAALGELARVYLTGRSGADALRNQVQALNLQDTSRPRGGSAQTRFSSGRWPASRAAC